MTDNCGRNIAIERLWARLMRTQAQMLKAVESDMKDDSMPPLSWYDVLLEVERAGDKGLRPFELECQLLLAQYNLSRLLDRLERGGYITRRTCSEDGRGKVVRITGSGRALRHKMWPVYSKAIRQAFVGRLTESEVRQLDKLLGRLLQAETG